MHLARAFLYRHHFWPMHIDDVARADIIADAAAVTLIKVEYNRHNLILS
jgi:hypothetical protein